MATYMIDYENVKTGGLNGISRLTEADKVIIFYSENANRITFDLHKRLMECKASIEYREVSVGGHNALDFQLVTYLGFLIAQDKDGQYLIISNDRGFEYVVNFWRKDGLAIGLLPYLKDPAYALQKAARPAEEAPASEASAPETVAEEPVTEEPATEEAAPEEIAEEAVTEEEPSIEVEFYSIEEEPTPAEEPVPIVVEVSKKTRRSPRKKAQSKKAEAVSEEPKAEPKAELKEEPKEEPAPAPVEESAPQPKAESKKESKPAKKTPEKPARKIPTTYELRELIGTLVEDDPELRFVGTAIAKYKTKLGLNNALVKNFGNQKAGEIYQKVKQFVK